MQKMNWFQVLKSENLLIVQVFSGNIIEYLCVYDGRSHLKTSPPVLVSKVITRFIDNGSAQLLQSHLFSWLGELALTWMRLSTLSWRAVGGLFLGRMERTKTPSTNSCEATRTWKRWPQFFTQASRTWQWHKPLYEKCNVKQLMLKSIQLNVFDFSCFD